MTSRAFLFVTVTVMSSGVLLLSVCRDWLQPEAAEIYFKISGRYTRSG